jgi:RHS repeat-associated protein
MGRVYQTISPDTGTTTYAYDPAGNLIAKTDAKGVTTSYVYDALNRLTKIDFPTDTDTIYAYDTCVNGKGRLCSMTDASGTTTYKYKPKGQVKSETKVIDGFTYVTLYSYDMNGNLKTMTYPSGRVITYNISNDKVISVLNNAANLATNINYKPFGGMLSITYGNGLNGTIGYDNQYRISSIQVGNILNLSYGSYDANGNITGITNTPDSTKNKTFTYDALDRLATATASGLWGSLGWTYDGVGNRQTENTNSYTYFSNTNKLGSANGKSYGYDSNGNTTGEGIRTFGYNDNQRLVTVSDAGVVYVYNGNGQRVKKVVSGTTTVFHYSLAGQIIAESNSSGTITAEYVYLNSQPLAKIEGANTYYYHNDHLATPQKMTDSTGTVVWSADYKPFGEATVTVSTITNNLRFPGQYFDGETGLNYNYYRDYNPAIGRYMEADPIGLDGGINPFTYVANKVVRWVDPLGLFKWHGNWGGPDWTAGQEKSWNDFSSDEKNKILAAVAIGDTKHGAPTDIEDELYMNHDIAYGNCRDNCANAECPRDCEKRCFNGADLVLAANLMRLGIKKPHWLKVWITVPAFIIQPGLRNGGYGQDGKYYQLRWEF